MSVDYRMCGREERSLRKLGCDAQIVLLELAA